MQSLKNFLHDDRAATASEYAVILGLIFLVCLATIGLLGKSTADNLSGSSDKIEQVLEP